jgi:hypothetical protein
MPAHCLVTLEIGATLSLVHFTSEEKLEAEHRFREFLRDYDLPQPDAVEYGFTCLRFYYSEPKMCVVFDLDPDAEDDPDADDDPDAEDDPALRTSRRSEE